MGHSALPWVLGQSAWLCDLQTKPAPGLGLWEAWQDNGRKEKAQR